VTAQPIPSGARPAVCDQAGAGSLRRLPLTVMSAVSPAAPAAPQAVVETALVPLERMSLSPRISWRRPGPGGGADVAGVRPGGVAAVSAGTRRAYGSYWNRILEHCGDRCLGEPTPSESRQLMTWVKMHVLAAGTRGGGRCSRSRPSGSPTGRWHKDRYRAAARLRGTRGRRRDPSVPPECRLISETAREVWNRGWRVIDGGTGWPG
jgi:hypothetical protein